MCVYLRYVFFFKQKTAYEMRISDWSSDVCSSDLDAPFAQVDAPRAVAMMFQSDDPFAADHLRAVDAHELVGVHARFQRFDRLVDQPAAAADVQAHIVALGLDQIDLARVDAQHLAAVLDPEFVDPLALFCGRPFGRTPFADARQRAREPIGGDRKSTRLTSSH